ncbi:MAG: hypothetical protein RLZZ301_199 [Bacteroidota bacterium]|jgi:hypothetical protein
MIGVGFWSVFLLGTVKFMISTLPGPKFGLLFYQTWLASFSGATFSAAVFYYGSELVMRISHRRRHLKREADLNAGKTPKNYARITKTKRYIIQLKWIFGRLGICLLGPTFFSVPIGAFVAAKFYGKYRFTFVYVVAGLAAFSLLLTSIAYGLF